MTAISDAREITGGLSSPSKMPWFSYNLPATACKVGRKLNKIKDSVCSKCYALKGRYSFGVVQRAMARRLEAIDHPSWVDAMAFEINHSAKLLLDDRQRYFRWHDSGDLQGVWHLEKINEVCLKTPTIRHWVPTREVKIVQDYQKKHGEFAPNLVVRVSAPMIGETIVGIPGLPVSTVGREGFGTQCEAYKRGGKCHECRACWSTDDINYPLH
jgi:hypothetical protein